MKVVLPHGGYGLGNDLIPWAKAYILSMEADARLLHPAWGNNPRQYYKYFRTFRGDYQLYRAVVKVLPRLRFTEEDYRQIGVNDFAEAARIFVEEHGLRLKKRYILQITGFWGAFSGLESARAFILSRLYNTAHTHRNLYAIAKRLSANRLTIGLHVRLGDFRPPGSYEYAGMEQVSIPLDWFCGIRDQLEQRFGKESLQFIICSDGNISALEQLLNRSNAILASAYPNSDISDLLLLHGADLLVCSISSYSMWAAFLSQAPYIWYRPNLLNDGARLSNRFIKSLGIYPPNEMAAQPAPGRGIAVGPANSISKELLDYLEMTLRNRASASDLVRGGALPGVPWRGPGGPWGRWAESPGQ